MKILRKSLSVFLTLNILFGVIQVGFLSNATTIIGKSEKEISIISLKKEDKYKTNEELATVVLKEAGMSEDEILIIPKEKLELIAHSSVLYVYSNLNNDFDNTMYVYKLGDKQKDKYGVINVFKWKNMRFAYRGKDQISLYGDALSANNNSFNLITSFKETQKVLWKTQSQKDIVNKYSFDDLKKQELISSAENMSVLCDLPNDINLLLYSKRYSLPKILIMGEFIMKNPDIESNFLVHSEYTHFNFFHSQSAHRISKGKTISDNVSGIINYKP